MTYLYTYIMIYKELKNIKFTSDKYTSNSQINELKNKYLKYYTYINCNIITKIIFRNYIKKINNIDKIINIKNEQFINNEIKKYKNIFNNIGGYPLDYNQTRAVIIDDDKNLVVAGAGSGKSLTMIGKIHYLIQTKGIKEEEILCISFTNEITRSLKNKLKKLYNYNIDVYTFHKLGYQILKNDNNITVASKSILENCIEQYFKSQEKEKIYQILEYFSKFTKIPKDYKVKNKYITLKSICLNKTEKVNSQIEVIIANTLYLKGIEYKYESTSYGSIYHLSNKNIYYYNFNNPLYTLNVIKNNSHINIYKYYFYENNFINTVEKIIKFNDIKSFPLDKNKIYQDMVENQNDYIVSLKNLIITFTNIYKSNLKTFEEINIKKNTIEYAFVSIFKEIYDMYEKILKNKNMIDVNDMILKATKLTNDEYNYKQYKYILIDEFQDTSKIRYQLIHNIIKHTNAKLVAVGDDFQSIYRFSGCDVDLFINFEKYFGQTKISYITNTYRNSQELINIAGTFVMKNPNQIKKQLYSNKYINNPVEIYYYDDLSTVFLKIIKSLSTGKEKIILGRNNKDIGLLNSNKILISDNYIQIKETKEKVPFLTIHKSKGLEYDYVFIINMTDDIMGFPSKLEEHKILKLVLPKEEKYKYAEERRLLYVALTRAKEKVFILAPKNNPSIFVKELEKDISLIKK